jgi:hypothetical protein
MNYIERLQIEVAQHERAATARQERFAELRRHLSLPKFQPQQDGSRGDWISTADVQRWLRYIENGDHS